MDSMLFCSFPGLNQMAVDALKHWKGEPMMVDGKPKAVIFAATVKFTLIKKDP